MNAEQSNRHSERTSIDSYEAANPHMTRAPSILVVDDVSANLQVLTGMLKAKGYKVRPVPSGKLALLASRKEPPDLILLDINMPEMDGYEVCRQLKADEALRGIPVIFISALNENLDKVNAFAIGGVDYITKPFQLEELHARVETHLKIRRLQVELEQSNLRLAKANDRMSRDLEAAAKIQKAFLPSKSPSVAGVEFAWCYRPCDELAGDGLNIIPLDEGKVGVYVLDVSGHGVSAALLSVTLSRLLSPPSEPNSILVSDSDPMGVRSLISPAEVANRLNRLFPYDTSTEQFATLVYGVLNVTTGEFRYVSAGHPGPLHLPVSGFPILHETPGFPIGLSDQMYGEQSIWLDAGDRFYLYSDGLPDVMSPGSERFGDVRVQESIHQQRGERLADGIDSVMEEIARWHGGRGHHDDISLLAVELFDHPSKSTN